MKSKLLVIDDERSVCELLQRVFVEEGHEVAIQMDPIAALQVLEKEKFDCVLLDIKMPEMDGSEFLRRIRQFNKELPIIISTAYGDYVQQDFSAWLSDGYTVKSSDLTELKSLVKEMLGE